jgi:hypothetical protein
MPDPSPTDLVRLRRQRGGSEACSGPRATSAPSEDRPAGRSYLAAADPRNDGGIPVYG